MGKTIGELMEEMRIKAGAQNYKGHDYLVRPKRKGLKTSTPVRMISAH